MNITHHLFLCLNISRSFKCLAKACTEAREGPQVLEMTVRIWIEIVAKEAQKAT